jgi:predicted RecA/RadA family phage recombinase
MADELRYEKAVEAEAYRLDPSGTYPVELGDLVYWDSANRWLRLMATGSNGPNFVGCAEGHGPTPASSIDNAPNKIKDIRVRHKGIFRFKTTAAESYDHGDALVIGADAQTILLQGGAAATEVIGYVWNPTASAAVTGAAGVEIDVLLKSNFPTVGLY